ncbi:hypothetical protein [Streptomyces sp. 8K308]|uniref:hypothetical protein n=1 Tax=Streptomyces sp. 8K308 TaxID=2530388 RepID=UPI001A9CDDBA|nr:hypothetical protein [Streptomyces sp. 8K308]
MVSSTWELSLRALADGGLPEAVTLLRLLSCWTGDPLPLSLLSGLELPRAEAALRGLLDQSLTEVVPGPVRCLRTHGVLLDSVARGIPAEQRAGLVEMAASLLLAVLPEIPVRGETDERYGLLAPHAIGLLRRDRRRGRGGSVAAIGRGHSPEWRLCGSARAGNGRFGPVAAGVGAGRSNRPSIHQDRVGRAVHRLGRAEEAVDEYRRLLADGERLLGPEDLDVFELCLGLANPLRALGSGSEGVALIHRAVIGRTAALGPDHPLT